MKHVVIAVVLVLGCGKRSGAPDAAVESKVERSRMTRARQALKTRVDAGRDETPPPSPPPELFTLVHYDAPLGKNVAFASPVARGERRPAIIWIIGGMTWGLGDTPWAPAERENDQSARAFREAGIVMMYPALRGASGNPGHNECFLGEVDDIIAAAAYLAARPDVDPKRIYLGGHSTGGTLALFAAASTKVFRAIFALGPVGAAEQYPQSCVPPGLPDEEYVARSIYPFLRDVAVPTLVIEGEHGNSMILPSLVEAAVPRSWVKVMEVPGFDHFDLIAPATEILAAAIGADDGAHMTFDHVTVEAITAAR